MFFNSLHYLIFLPIVVVFYFLLPKNYRWAFLLAASYYFYMCWKLEYIILIIASTLIDYYAGIQMEKQKKKAKRKLFLLLSLCSNLGILFAFKYFNFLSESTSYIFNQFNIFYDAPLLNVLLPVGISFYTFQTLSYSIEVYYGKQKAERHLGYFALYVSFFPQLVAGPIERYATLGKQLKEYHKFNYENLKNGLRLILYGFFIKMVIADNVAVYVDEIYDNPLIYNSWSVISGLVLYSFQIYSDFYGYSIIAIGSALILGVKIMDNFKTPYLSKGISEFWSRWHISLSTWFRDYLYIPLGGNKVKVSRWYLNIFIVFTVSGLWHGANWTFVIWGTLHGLLYMLENLINKVFPVDTTKQFSILNILKILKTYLLVTFIWIFFRSETFEKAQDIILSIKNNFKLEDSFSIDAKVWILLVLFILSDILFYNTRFDKWSSRQNIFIRWISYAIILFSIMALAGVNNQPFIYFQF